MKRILFAWFFVLLCMALIYAISDQSIAGTPGGNFFEKPAHIFEFSFLGLLCINAFAQTVGLKRAGFAIVCGALLATAYACSDEWHQSWVPQRHSDISDVAADALGILMTALLCSRFLAGSLPALLQSLAWLPGLIIFFAVLIPTVELGFLISLYGKFGFLQASGWLAGTALLGGFVIWWLFKKTITPLQGGIAALNLLPNIPDRLALLAGGLLLVLPGLLGDAVGFALLISPLRKAVIDMILFLIKERMTGLVAMASAPPNMNFWHMNR